MPRIAERFRDPLGVVPNYEFHINHSDEDAQEKKRNIETTAPTTGVGFVRQQGAASPETLRYSGTILHKAQKDAMDAWFDLCENQTVFFRDFTGREMEVEILSFNPVRKRAAGNPQDPVNAPLHYWTYTLEMQVIAG